VQAKEHFVSGASGGPELHILSAYTISPDHLDLVGYPFRKQMDSPTLVYSPGVISGISTITSGAKNPE
jgi:hypothetical protein